jgi:cytochrome c oxidase subunit IV
LPLKYYSSLRPDQLLYIAAGCDRLQHTCCIVLTNGHYTFTMRVYFFHFYFFFHARQLRPRTSVNSEPLIDQELIGSCTVPPYAYFCISDTSYRFVYDLLYLLDTVRTWVTFFLCRTNILRWWIFFQFSLPIFRQCLSINVFPHCVWHCLNILRIFLFRKLLQQFHHLLKHCKLPNRKYNRFPFKIQFYIIVRAQILCSSQELE